MTDRTKTLEQRAVTAHREGKTLDQFLRENPGRTNEPRPYGDVAAEVLKLVEIFNRQPKPDPVVVAIDRGFAQVATTLREALYGTTGEDDSLQDAVSRTANALERVAEAIEDAH